MLRTIPISVLQQKFNYDPNTGAVSYRFKSGKYPAGAEAGSLSDDGYRVLKVPYAGRRTQIACHIIAWALSYGEYPVGDVDHRDTIRTNNRLSNLRSSTRSQNLANRNKKGDLPKGVTLVKKRKSKPFQAQISVNNKKKFLGYFENPAEAHLVYLAAAEVAFGEFVRV